MDCRQFPLTHKQRTKLNELRWLNAHAHTWNIAVTWHFPNRIRSYFGGWDHHWHSKEFRRYLNRVDRKIYKAAHKNRMERLPRIIALEDKDEVGWHVHGLLTNPPHLDEAATSAIIVNEWKCYMKRFASTKFEKHLIEIGPVRTDYISYLSKFTFDESDDPLGIIDDKNTYLPEIHHH
jgi:hypothetical protein